MFKIFKSNAAFNRTTPHPADSSVRIAHSVDDLMALHYRNKARAVIFKRTLSPKIITELDRYQATKQADMDMIRGPYVKNEGEGMRFGICDKTSPGIRKCPTMIQDMAQIAAAFYKAGGVKKFDRAEGLIVAEWGPYPAHETVPREQFRLTEPHIDKGNVQEQSRLTCGYSAITQNTGTGWLPGRFTIKDLGHICEEYLDAANPVAVLEKYHYQSTDAGDLVYFIAEHPKADKVRPGHALAHFSPLPPKEKARLCLLLTA